MFDVFFLSYGEPNAEKNYERLLEKAPNALRISGIKGILNAHKAAAKKSRTDYFYIVDADAVIENNFEFSFMPADDVVDSVYVWRARNPVNDLIYGYGGVKLFPKKNLLKIKKTNIDITTSLGIIFSPQNEISNITDFNTDPFNSWKSAFRECVKLSSGVIPNSGNLENQRRLDIWCSKGEDKPFGKYCITGAKQGKAYGEEYKNNQNKLKLINNFDWLEEIFKRYVG